MPVPMVIAVGLLIVGFVTCIQDPGKSRLQGGYVVSLTVMLHGLPAFVYTELTSAWAWKHVALVEYLQRTGVADRQAPTFTVYQNWPGFFALNAWIGEASDLPNVLAYAAYSPIVFNLGFVLALAILFRAFTDDIRLIWSAILLFELTNWVGQDYFAPQALAYLMYLMVLAILIRWYRSPKAGGSADLAPSLSIRIVATPIVVLLLLAIAMSHQITPIMTAIAIAALVVFGGLEVRWPAVVAVVVMVAWMFGPALPFTSEGLSDLLGDLGAFQQNVGGSVVNVAELSRGAHTVATISRALSALVVVLAALGVVRRWRVGVESRWIILLALAPAGALALSSYGGEIIFRVYLFALPFLAFLAASMFFPSREVGRHPVALVGLAAAVPMLTVALLVASFGSDERTVFTADEVAAATIVTESTTPAFVIEGSHDYPGQYRSYEQFSQLTLDRLPSKALDRVIDDPAATLAEWIAASPEGTGFVVLTSSQQRSVARLGTLPVDVLPDVRSSLLRSAEFRMIYSSGGATVFEFSGAPT